jgi:Tol biopolymer transport system component
MALVSGAIVLAAGSLVGVVTTASSKPGENIDQVAYIQEQPFPLPPSSSSNCDPATNLCVEDSSDSTDGPPDAGEVFVVDIDGSDRQQLTIRNETDGDDDDRDNHFPVWSPNGEKIAFSGTTQNVDEHPDGPPNLQRTEEKSLWTMNRDGSGKVKIASLAAPEAARWSPDSTRLAFHSERDFTDENEIQDDGDTVWYEGDHSSIVVARADGGGETMVTNSDSVNEFDDAFPAWSPNSQRLAFFRDLDGNEDNVELVIADATTNATLVTTLSTPMNDAFPQWSPDGMWIAFHVDDGDDEYPELYVANAVSGAVTQITNTTNVDTPRDCPDRSSSSSTATDECGPARPQWSPDSTKLAFAMGTENGDGDDPAETWIINRDGSGARRVSSSLVDNPANPIWGSRFFKWSPDGTKLAFRSPDGDCCSTTPRQDGIESIYVVPTDGSAGPMTVTTNGTRFFDWSTDSQRIVYQGRTGADAVAPVNNTTAGAGSGKDKPEGKASGKAMAKSDDEASTNGVSPNVPNNNGYGDYDILVRNIDGTNEVNLSDGAVDNDLDDLQPSVRPLPRLSSGYRLIASDGGVFTFGNRNFQGSLGDMRLNEPVVGGATNLATLDGYWMVASDGGVFAFHTPFFGSAIGLLQGSKATEIEPTVTGLGYWVVTARGKVLTFGDAVSFGDMSTQPLAGEIIGMATTTTGKGYWLIGSDGGIFAFGDARYRGSMGGILLNAPIVDLTSTADDGGYYLIAADGGVFAFGNAVYRGGMGGIRLNAPVVAGLLGPTGTGYWMGAMDGGVFSFQMPFHGSMGSTRLNQPVNDMIY